MQIIWIGTSIALGLVILLLDDRFYDSGKALCKLHAVVCLNAFDWHLSLIHIYRMQMTDLFDVIVCGDMCAERKPDPECYLKAMGLLLSLIHI